MVVESATFTAKPVKLGNFYLSDSMFLFYIITIVLRLYRICYNFKK